MKTSALLPVLAAVLSSCSEPSATTGAGPAPENGAQFRKDHGLTLTDEMKQAIGLKLVEVGEEKVAPAFTVPLHVMPENGLQRVSLTPKKTESREASGWLTAEQAPLVKPGMKVELRSEATDAAVESGTVLRVEKAAHALLGDYEVTVTSAKPLPDGTALHATFRGSAGEAVTSIPRSALLTTAEGTFAYTVNGEAYLRTAVKVGALNEQFAEITDGLYPGDEVVSAPVMSLWMAELQVLRGGKACTCGH